MSSITVSVARQELVLQGDGSSRRWPVSTSRHGVGEVEDSQRTPRGRHVVCAMLGAGLPPGTVLKGRRPTGEVVTAAQAAACPGRDWITTRILWLSGLEPGRNRGGQVDSMRRYIYIHGTPHAAQVGTPGSIGCVRMTDADVSELFDLVAPGTVVDINED